MERESIDPYLLSEKTHPRKRLKGRKGCPGAKNKGSQRKFSPSEFYREERYVGSSKYESPLGTITKYKNYHFDEDIDEFDKRTFDDGGMEYTPKDRYRHINYSLNKKKRWELKDNLKESGGYSSHLPDGVIGVQEKLEEEEKKKLDDLMSPEYIEAQLEEMNKDNTSTNSARKKKKKIKLKKYIMNKRQELRRLKERGADWYERYGVEREIQNASISDFNIKQKKKRHHQVANNIRKTEIEKKRKNHLKKTVRRRKKKNKYREESEEEEEERNNREKDAFDRIKNNQDFYFFNTKDKRKWYRRPRDTFKCTARYGKPESKKTKRDKITKEIRSSLTFKSKFVKV